MFRARVFASERTDVAHEVEGLTARARAKGLSPTQTDEMSGQVREALATLVERGQALVEGHSNMTVDRTINGSGYRVQVHFQTGGGGGGLLARLRRALGL